MLDIQELNQEALAGRFDMIKVSYALWPQLHDRYVLLTAGSALGFGVGPLLIARQDWKPEDLLAEHRVAAPGLQTTAVLLLRHAFPRLTRILPLRFDRIEQAVLSDQADLGLVIHENRFTYASLGLHCVADLGSIWEETKGLPIPLGGIAVKRSLGKQRIQDLDAQLKRSIQYAFANEASIMPFVRAHAQAMEDHVMQQHIQLYVNQETLQLSASGKAAIRALSTGYTVKEEKPWFADEL